MKWTDEQIDTVRRLYPSYSTADLAFLVGRSESGVMQLARKLGLSKTPEFMATHARRFRSGQVTWNKGMKGLRTPGSEKGWFKKGSAPPNTLPVGAHRVTKDGTLQRKITNLPGPPQVRWRSVHELVWIAANGPVPEGHICVFKEGMATAKLEEITLDRVECISWADNMRRNSVHRLPKELAELVQLRGALQRQINAAERGMNAGLE